jgi:hypothetical protein
MVIIPHFTFSLATAKNFNYFESQPSTNNARSAKLDAPGHGYPLIKMQRSALQASDIGLLSQKNVFLMDID